MPCNSDYMESTPREKALTKVVLLLDELDGKGPPDSEKFHTGYDSRAYGDPPTKEIADGWTRDLCTRLQAVTDITGCSLELQTWWRDHQQADATRLAAELKKQQTEADRRATIAKLSPYERQLLGV